MAAKRRKGPTPKKSKANTPNPIPLMLLRVFQGQIASQCEFALKAAEDLLNLQDPWYAAQNLLGAVGNISKALWGVNPTAEKAREPLRDSLGVTEDCVLRVRNVRNHWEHLDERLDEWWRDSVTHNYIDRNIAPGPVIGTMIGGPGAAAINQLDVFRNFNSAAGELTFWGDTFDVPAIVEELQRLYPMAKAESDKPHWDPPSTSGGGQ